MRVEQGRPFQCGKRLRPVAMIEKNGAQGCMESRLRCIQPDSLSYMNGGTFSILFVEGDQAPQKSRLRVVRCNS